MFTTDLYLQFSVDRVQIRNLPDGRSVDRSSPEGFSHQRMLIGDFTRAQVLIKSAVAEVAGASFLRSLRVLVHPMERIEGGLNEIERRVLQELMIGAGARKVEIWMGPVLSDEAAREKLR